MLTTYGELPGWVRSVEGPDSYAIRIGFPGLPDWILVDGAELRRPMDAAADVQLAEVDSLTTARPAGVGKVNRAWAGWPVPRRKPGEE